MAVQSAASSKGCLCRGGPVRVMMTLQWPEEGEGEHSKSSQESGLCVSKGAEGCSNEAGIGLESPCSACLRSDRPMPYVCATAS